MTENLDGIIFSDDLDHIEEGQLEGFFVDWPTPPSPATHLRHLRGAQHRLLALDAHTGRVVGFITALSDGVLTAFIPLLEVLPAYQGRGIGSELVRLMLARLQNLYAVDLLCDPDLQPFYKRLGLTPLTGMALRNYSRLPASS